MLVNLSSVSTVVVALAQMVTASPITSFSANSTEVLAINKRANNNTVTATYDLQEARIGCNDRECNQTIVVVNANFNFEQTCPRLALTAKANRLSQCAPEVKKFAKGDDCDHQDPNEPDIIVCCSRWVYEADPFYKGYSTVAFPENGTAWPLATGKQLFATQKHPAEDEVTEAEYISWKKEPDKIYRRVIRPYAYEFNHRAEMCRKWVPESEGTFQYFMQELSFMGIDEKVELEKSNVEGIALPADYGTIWAFDPAENDDDPDASSPGDDY